jgi:hypothetical protein
MILHYDMMPASSLDPPEQQCGSECYDVAATLMPYRAGLSHFQVFRQLCGLEGVSESSSFVL